MHDDILIRVDALRSYLRVQRDATKGVRALRHSCVVQLARAGCDVPEIAASPATTPTRRTRFSRSTCLGTTKWHGTPSASGA